MSNSRGGFAPKRIPLKLFLFIRLESFLLYEVSAAKQLVLSDLMRQLLACCRRHFTSLAN